METQTGHETALRWSLRVAPPVELVHLWVSFSFLSIFSLSLFSFTFSPTVQQQAASPDFSVSFLSFIHFLFLSHWQVAGLTFKRRYKGEIGSLYITTVTGPFRGDGCWSASVKAAEVFVSWSHSEAHACCSLPSPPLSGRVFASPFLVLASVWRIL